MYIDTHTHLYLEEFAPTPSDGVDRALVAGVDMMIFPNVDLSTVKPMLSLASLYPDNVRTAMGLHPTEVKQGWEESLAVIKEYLDGEPRSHVAVGEIGMDLYWDKTFREEQMMAFERQVEWAEERHLPVIIHNRDALWETLEVMSRFGNRVKAVFHSFGGSREDVEAVRRVGDYYFGINGIVTFKNSRLREVLPEIGIERIVLETDSPYLAPVPMRGKRNESAYIVHTACHVANALGLTPEEVGSNTSQNAGVLFRL